MPLFPAPVSQLLLDLPLDPVLTFDSLVVGQGNRLALEAVRQLMAAGQGSLTLVGESGTGKSHLLAAAVGLFRQQGGRAAYLDVAPLLPHVQRVGEGMLARLLADHVGCGLVALDGLDLLESSPGMQEVALYLFNQIRGAAGMLLMAGRCYPGELQGVREDLRSRFSWGPVVALTPPSDEMLADILTKLADDRQVRLASGVVQFLVLRLPRRVADHLAAMARLDHAALERQRPITIALAKEVLGL